MTAPYQKLLSALRQQFPAPAASREQGAAHADAVLRSLAEIVPNVVEPTPVEPTLNDALLAAQGVPIDAVAAELRRYAEGMPLWGGPAVQMNVIPGPTTASIYGGLLASIYNPNLCDAEGSGGFSAAEGQVIRLAADLVGYDPTAADGVFTFGGTGAMLYGARIGLEKAAPGSFRDGVHKAAVVLTSDQSHYCVSNVASWLGLGDRQALRIATNSDSSINLTALEHAAREALATGRRIAVIVATMGSTDAFGIDDLRAIHALREQLVRDFDLPYRPHIHADAAIGWAWSALNDYDFEVNPLGFRDATLRSLLTASERLRWLAFADSIGLDFHKTGYAPYIASLVLFRDRADFELIRRSPEETPYLSRSDSRCPGAFTLETSRNAAGPLAALASLRVLGKEGLRTLIGHAVDMSQVARELIVSRPEMAVVNDANVGPVTLFRMYPPDVNARGALGRERTESGYQSHAAAHNEYNRRIYARLAATAGATRKGIHLSMTDGCRTKWETPIVALKSYVLSPFTGEADMAAVVREALAAQQAENATRPPVDCAAR